jgi:hypothetical protein
MSELLHRSWDATHIGSYVPYVTDTPAPDKHCADTPVNGHLMGDRDPSSYR